MSYQNLLTQTENGILTITINRPDKLNALNKNTLDELNKCLTEGENNPEVKTVIITGSGTKAFIAGADISEFKDYDVSQGKELSASGHKKVFDLVENFKKPVIAAVNGFALGGGLELAMSCHIRVASENAKMGLPEVTLGIIPGYGGTQRLAQLVGKGKAFEMITTAEMVKADEAKEIGLVNHVTSAEELLPKCIAIAQKMMANSPAAISSAIEAINAGYNIKMNGYEKEIELFGKCFSTADFKEGTKAFLEKRKANFTGK
jgi:enoyl-CoA hydratase